MATPACTVKDRLCECDSDPLVPCAEIVKFPVVALDEAPKTTDVLASATMLNGLAGFEATPAGSPLRETCTFPVNPLLGFTETLTAELVPPCERETIFAERLSEKSGEGGGGGGVTEDPPPQPVQAHASRKSSRMGGRLGIRPTTQLRKSAPNAGFVQLQRSSLRANREGIAYDDSYA